MYTIIFSDESDSQLKYLKLDNSQKAQFKAILKALNFLQSNPRHPGLNSKKYKTLKGPNGEPVFESYAQQRTPGAYRIFWFYGPQRLQITIVMIIPHP